MVCPEGKEKVGQIMMMIGRAVFGLGGENLTVATSSFIGQWFKGGELACALGVDISAARIAASVNDAIQPKLYTDSGNKLHLGFWVGFGCTVYGFTLALVTVVLDTLADKAEKKEKDEADAKLPLNDTGKTKDESEEVRLSDMFSFGLPYWLITLNCVFFYMAYFSFMNVVSDLMQIRFGIDFEVCGFIMVT